MKFSASGVAWRCRKVFARFPMVTLVLLVASNARAFLPPERPLLPNFDKRVPSQPPPAGLSESLAALEKLRARLPGARVDFDPVTGAPKMVSGGEGFLSGVNGVGKAVSPT